MRRTLLLFLLLSLPPVLSRAAVSWYVSGEGVSGPNDYRETTAEAGFFARTRKKKGHFVQGSWGFASRTAFGVRNSTQTTVTWTGGMGLEFPRGVGVDGSYWITPGPRVPGDGSYRAQGADGGLTTRWLGLTPFFRWPYRRSLRTTLSLSGGWALHEEYFITPLATRPAREWFGIHQANAGASLTWLLYGTFSVGADGRLYSYNHDLDVLFDNLSLLPLSTLGATGAYDLVLGFPERTWGFRAGVGLWSWGDVSLRWRRTAYRIGVAPWSDTASASVGLYFWRGCGARARYEVNQPRGGERAAYKGVGVELGF